MVVEESDCGYSSCSSSGSSCSGSGSGFFNLFLFLSLFLIDFNDRGKIYLQFVLIGKVKFVFRIAYLITRCK